MLNAELPLPSFRRSGLADEVYEYLKSQIMSNRIEPDRPLRIDALARELGVSPTPVREALAKLESNALVTKHGTRGYFSNPVITGAEYDDLMAFRTVLEPWAAGEAARRADAADRVLLRAEIDNPTGNGEPIDFTSWREMQEHDQRLHELVFRIAGNETAAQAFERAHVHLRTFRIANASHLGPDGVAEHRAIVEAIIAGDAQAAADAMREHLHQSRIRLDPHLQRD